MFKFNLAAFDEEISWDTPKQKWTNIGVDRLSPTEQAVIAEFAYHAAGCQDDAQWNQYMDQDFNRDNVLLAKADAKMRYYEQVYGPAIQRDNEGNLVMVLGSNVFPVRVDTKGAGPGDPYVFIGNLQGMFFGDKPKDKPDEYVKVSAATPDGAFYEINCLFENAVSGLKDVLAVLKAPEKLAALFEEKKAGGVMEIRGTLPEKDSVPTVKAKELPVGVYPILGMGEKPGDPEATDYHKNPSYALSVGGVAVMWVNGDTTGGRQLTSLFKQEYDPNQEFFLTMIVELVNWDEPKGNRTLRFKKGAFRGLEDSPVKTLLGGSNAPAIAPAIDTAAATVADARAALETPPPAIMTAPQAKPVTTVDLDAMPF